ncbi:hypothetical protein Ari01nite_75170 [Paractinoplanes rishiriensis]|uniref:Uncharacterized protein n=1 Tax=Paractinoplanes rishiriensis TaxID=1050105 RepID=A0A919K652_9ACTN|nr:hypothetical protein Ari01nite_75170 [Actinoplanes rishiriensis]
MGILSIARVSRHVIVHITACLGSLRITTITVKLINVLCPNDPQVPIETFLEEHLAGTAEWAERTG